MEITEELLSTVYKRATIFATTKYGNEPDVLKLYDDGLYAVWINYCRGNPEEKSEYISAADLIADLDAIAEERKIKLEQEAIKQKVYYEEQKKLRIEREIRQRKEEYEKLKKEFEK